VQGNIIQVGNIVTETLTIQLANAASTANAANGAGITVGANDNIATLLSVMYPMLGPQTLASVRLVISLHHILLVMVAYLLVWPLPMVIVMLLHCWLGLVQIL
jgi:hypothetical protein